MARRFYYDTGKEKVGPISGKDLLRMRATGELSKETWVRRADSATWRPLHSVNLRKEEEELRNPDFFTLLKQSGMIVPFVFLMMGLGLILLILLGAFKLLWPVVLVLIIIWLVKKK